MKKIIKNKKRGFSLVEVLVAMTVLTIGITSISILMAKSAKNADDARDQIVASSLAQEGIELIKNLKDNNALGVYKNNTITPNSGLTIDATAPGTLNTTNPPRLKWNGSYFNYSTGTVTKFYRDIAFSIVGDSSNVPSTRVITVTSRVWWGGSSAPGTCNIASKCVDIITLMPDLQ